MLGIMDWNLWGWGKAADMETEIKCSVNKCLLGHAETTGCTWNSYLRHTMISPLHLESSCSLQIPLVIGPFWRQAPCLNASGS